MTSNDRKSGGAAAIVLSSDALDPRDRFDAWREELMLRVMRVDVSVPDRLAFRTRLRIHNLPNLGIIERRTTPSLVKRTAELVRDGDDSLVFSLPWRGTVEAGARWSGRGRRHLPARGEHQRSVGRLPRRVDQDGARHRPARSSDLR
jgi:hypothetical protein